MALTSQLPPSSCFWVDCHIHYIPHKHYKLTAFKVVMSSLSAFLSNKTCFSYLHLHSGLSRWLHHSEIYKSRGIPPISQPWISHRGWLPSPAPSSPALPLFWFSYSDCFNNPLIVFPASRLNSPQSNASKMQIWPRHFSAWILSTVTIHFKFSSGLKGLPWPLLTSGLPNSHLCSNKMLSVL